MDIGCFLFLRFLGGWGGVGGVVSVTAWGGGRGAGGWVERGNGRQRKLKSMSGGGGGDDPCPVARRGNGASIFRGCQRRRERGASFAAVRGKQSRRRTCRWWRRRRLKLSMSGELAIGYRSCDVRDTGSLPHSCL